MSKNKYQRQRAMHEPTAGFKYQKKPIQNNLDLRLKNTKNLLSSCIENNIPTPVMYSSLNWYITSSSEFNPSSLIQAQRDYFGAHRVQLHESNEFLHLNWD